jgi:hypothetical protein
VHLRAECHHAGLAELAQHTATGVRVCRAVQRESGIHYTVVNGEMLLEKGAERRPHKGLGKGHWGEIGDSPCRLHDAGVPAAPIAARRQVFYSGATSVRPAARIMAGSMVLIQSMLGP